MTVLLGIHKFGHNYLSSLQLSVCIGVAVHTEFKCHVKCLQNNYTLIQQLKVIEYKGSHRSEKRGINLILMQKF